MDRHNLAGLPWPAFLLHADGKLDASSEVEKVLGFVPHDLKHLEDRFEVILPSGYPAEPAGLRWRRSEPLDELQMWRDRESGRAYSLRVLCRTIADRKLAILLDESHDVSREVHAELFLRALNRSVAGSIGDRTLHEVLRLIVEVACDLTGARYGALGVLNRRGTGLSDFIYSGIPAEMAGRIGHLPEGKGLLGALISERRTIRIPRISADPRSVGFPAHHPPMQSFLGAPLLEDGQVFGNFYLTDKIGADEFTAEDAGSLERFSVQAALTVKLVRQSDGEQRTLFRTLVEKAPYGIAFFPEGDGDIFGNPAAERMLGKITRADDPERSYDLLRPDGCALPSSELPATAALAGRTIINLEVLIQRHGRRALPALVSAAPVLSESERLLGAVVIYQDISPLKELERLRDEFTAIVANDMRTPVQAVLLHAEALLRRASGEAAWVPVTTIQTIQRSGQRLSRLIGDLLDASRLDSQRLSLSPRVVDLSVAIGAIVEQMRSILEGRAVRLDVHSPPLVYADPVRLEQVMTNLLENAAKYSEPEAPIEVSVTADGGEALLSVRDFGAGIPAEEQPKLFDRYFRGVRSRDKRSGLGLGLYITRGLVEAHGGRISVESEPGCGSVFRVWLPAVDHTHHTAMETDALQP
ncbi:MAG: GAF domain-containing protein [Deltaproteobacteria bacterium]|nr:GAF domain-containing protein [Deltaproteobacteria bacterium]